ncbi:MAG: hypothetical protein ACFFAO_18290 [Candidatus Hermodarchaeota archaeon]
MMESEYYDLLFGQFSQLNGNSLEKELWKNNQIRNLMIDFKDKADSMFIRNALLVIMALFDDYLKDTFLLNSQSVKKISQEEKDLIISILKELFPH